MYRMAVHGGHKAPVTIEPNEKYTTRLALVQTLIHGKGVSNVQAGDPPGKFGRRATLTGACAEMPPAAGAATVFISSSPSFRGGPIGDPGSSLCISSWRVQY